jgi:hypothetical protein
MAMKEENKVDTCRLTRRAALGGGIAMGLACLLPREILRRLGTPYGSPAGQRTRVNGKRSNLYAFAGPIGETTVIALTWPQQSRDSGRDMDPITEVRIHTGPESRSISMPSENTRAVEWEDNGCRVFTGSVCAATEAEERQVNAVVLEMPKHVVLGKPAMEIWAELQSESGARRRIGSPFLSELVAKDDALADLYHASSPAVDLQLLAAGVEEAVTARACAAGHVSKPQQYGRRLVSSLLPDFLHFDPTQPSGFTFASQNGRHPAESSDVVVNSLLSGSPAIGSSAPGTAHLKSDFPYFYPHPYGV